SRPRAKRLPRGRDLAHWNWHFGMGTLEWAHRAMTTSSAPGQGSSACATRVAGSHLPRAASWRLWRPNTPQGLSPPFDRGAWGSERRGTLLGKDFQGIVARASRLLTFLRRVGGFS